LGTTHEMKDLRDTFDCLYEYIHRSAYSEHLDFTYTTMNLSDLTNHTTDFSLHFPVIESKKSTKSSLLFDEGDIIKTPPYLGCLTRLFHEN